VVKKTSTQNESNHTNAIKRPKQSKREIDQKTEKKQKDDKEIDTEDIQSKQEDTEETTEQAQEKVTQSGVEILNVVEENEKLLEEIDRGEMDKPKNYKLPPLKFLADPPKRNNHVNESEIDQKISDLLDKLRRFKIDGDVVRTYSGPVVTTFEFKPAPHIKVSKILTLQDDLAMALRAQTIRIQAPVPGKDVVGIEVPNKKIETIFLKEILQSDIYKNSSSPLTIALGKDIVGNPFVTDLKKLPHLLIAGTTGSGKSVGINAMLLSLLYRNSPDTLKLLMIDPKMLEFSIYNDIPHLLTPVITKPKHAITALANMVSEMERRYKILSQSKTKNIENYNEKAKKLGMPHIPYIVVIIDELADLMMTSGKEVEFYVSRLAQMARASGIHLLVATQRPSVDVVTGLIKANLPSRISFKVGQKIDSKVILDASGADSLLGRGDMLFTPPGSSGLIRLHAPFASEEEIEKVVEYLKKQQTVEYDESFLKESESSASSGASVDDEIDELFEDAKNIVLNEKKCSISYIQRRLQIGYNRAARIVEQLEATGVLSSPNSKGQREIL
jgi:S-DNA-T family DNA segregation ATPase FtsK/SpoIIIE